MLLKFLLSVTIVLYVSSTISLNDDPWTEAQVLELINKQKPSLKDFIYDPDEIIGSDVAQRIHDKYFKYLTQEMGKNLYIISLSNIKDNFKANELLENYAYPDDANKNNSIFVVFGEEYHTWVYAYGSDVNFSNKYLQDLFALIREMSMEFSVDYDDLFKELIKGLRAGLIIPENYWLPSTLKDKFLSDMPSSVPSYKFYDPLLTVNETFQADCLEEYFKESIGENVKVYILVVTKVHSNYDEENINAFLNQFVNNISDSKIDKNNSVFGLYVTWDKLLTMKVGKGLGGDLEKSDLQEFISTSSDWDNLDKSFIAFMKNNRFYIVGERRGWTGTIFAKYLKDDAGYRHPPYYFHYLKSSGTSDDKKYVNGIMKGLYNNLTLHTLGIYLDKLYGNETLENFAVSFFKNYEFKSETFKITNTLFVFVIGDNKTFGIIIGSDFKSKLPQSKIDSIQSKAKSSATTGKSMEAFKIMLQQVRFEMIISVSDFTGWTLGDYFNDFIGKQDYYFYDQTEKIPKEDIKNELNSHFEILKNKNIFAYLFYLDKIHEKYKNDLQGFTDELLLSMSDPDRIINQYIYTTKYVVVVYYKSAKKYCISRGKDFQYYLNEEDINQIMKYTEPEGKLISFKHILKGLKYFLIYNINDWTSNNINDYINDFLDRSKGYMLFDPDLSFSIDENNHIYSYLMDLSDKDSHILIFNLKNVNINEPKFIEKLIEDYQFPEGAPKEKCIFITYYFKSYKIYYKIGDSLTSKISSSELNTIVNEASTKYLQEKNSYDAFRYILINIRKKFIDDKEDSWTGEKIADFYNKKYLPPDNNFDLINYYLDIEKEQESVIINLLKNLYDTSKIYTYVFIVNKLSSTIESTIPELFEKVDTNHIKDKDNSLIILYSSEKKDRSIYQGNAMKHIITNNYVKELVLESYQYNDTLSILRNIIFSIIDQGKVERSYTPSRIKEIFTEKYSASESLVFDPHRNLDEKQKINLDLLSTKLSSKNSTHIYSFIFGTLGKNTNSEIDDYINSLSTDFPIPSILKDETIVFIVYVTSSNIIGYKVNNNHKTSNKLGEIISDSKSHFNEGVYNGLDYVYTHLNKYLDSIKVKKGGYKKIWVILSISLGIIVIICLIIIIFMRIFKKSNMSTTVEKDIKQNCDLLVKDSELI